MASFRIDPDYVEKPANKLKTQKTPQANIFQNLIQFWSMIQNTFKDKKGNWQNPLKKVEYLGKEYAGDDRLKLYEELLGR